jgi:plasmid stability protein
MVSVMIIRHIDDAIMTRLRVCAAMNGRSMKEEARVILRSALSTERRRQPSNLVGAIR